MACLLSLIEFSHPILSEPGGVEPPPNSSAFNYERDKLNEDSIRAIASGFVKILFPHGDVSAEDLYRHCVQPATKLRQLVWDQLYSLDSEYRQFEQELVCEIV